MHPHGLKAYIERGLLEMERGVCIIQSRFFGAVSIFGIWLHAVDQFGNK